MGVFDQDRFIAAINIDKDSDAIWKTLAADVGDDPSWLKCWPNMDGSSKLGTVLKVDPGQRIVVRKEAEPCKETLIIISINADNTGTTVTVEQSNLPAWVQLSVDTFVLGGDQIVADLALLLERGVQIARHSMPWSFSGLIVREVSTGLEVASTIPGSFAERSGIQAGDLLISFGGAPVFTQLCLQALQRVFKTGENVVLSWVRGTVLEQGSATL